jgi:hypothetical protein
MAPIWTVVFSIAYKLWPIRSGLENPPVLSRFALHRHIVGHSASKVGIKAWVPTERLDNGLVLTFRKLAPGNFGNYFVAKRIPTTTRDSLRRNQQKTDKSDSL